MSTDNEYEESYRKKFPKGKDWKTPKKNPYGFCGLNESSYHGMEVIGMTKEKYEELEQKLDQQTQDYHFDMRNKQMEIVMQKNQILQLEMEIAELKDKLIELGEKL